MWWVMLLLIEFAEAFAAPLLPSYRHLGINGYVRVGVWTCGRVLVRQEGGSDTLS